MKKEKTKKNNNSTKLKHILNKVTLENFSGDVEEIVNIFDVWKKEMHFRNGRGFSICKGNLPIIRKSI